MKRNLSLFLLALILSASAQAQLKYIVNDFEGLSAQFFNPNESGLFTFGNAGMQADQLYGKTQSYAGTSCLSIDQGPEPDFGGWGQGINAFVELDPALDHFCFFARSTLHGTWKQGDHLSIELQDDDDGDGQFDAARDDQWITSVVLNDNSDWQLLSTPLYLFTDLNSGGDGCFNINHKEGKLLCIVFHLPEFAKLGNGVSGAIWKFDFLCFSKGALPTGDTLFAAAKPNADRFCHLGAWSFTNKEDRFCNIPSSFSAALGHEDQRFLSVVHFFQPFAMDADDAEHWMPYTDDINRLITQGYLPMITLEDHYIKRPSSMPQPNLYSIVEGHFDDFFTEWAHRISDVHGTVLVRLLHEFNGDWFPWSTANNDQNPDLVIRAFRHIHDIFVKADASNVRFVWCPNSLSKPDEDWNFILDAYPGDDYVDFVGLDIYNGAGEGFQPWRSFRKEGIPNYYLLTQNFPKKPFLVCETASRERSSTGNDSGQGKAEWIEQMVDALQTDMSEVRLLTWFNERPGFVVNSSTAALSAFKQKVLNDTHFRTGTDLLLPLTNTKR